MSTEKKTVFLVDDDATNLIVGRTSLAEHYNVLTLDSGARLMKMLEKNIPDLILLDVEMPEMNGYEVLEQLKNNPETANIPVIFLTAKTDGESELAGLSLGAMDYVTKPFSAQLLLKRIELQLRLSAQKCELLKKGLSNENVARLKEDCRGKG